jgi:hypothetical protein
MGDGTRTQATGDGGRQPQDTILSPCPGLPRWQTQREGTEELPISRVPLFTCPRVRHSLPGGATAARGRWGGSSGSSRASTANSPSACSTPNTATTAPAQQPPRHTMSTKSRQRGMQRPSGAGGSAGACHSGSRESAESAAPQWGGLTCGIAGGVKGLPREADAAAHVLQDEVVLRMHQLGSSYQGGR